MNRERFLLHCAMIAAFQGQLELREIAVTSNEIGHQYSLHRRMEFVMLYKTLSALTTGP